MIIFPFYVRVCVSQRYEFLCVLVCVDKYFWSHNRVAQAKALTLGFCPMRTVFLQVKRGVGWYTVFAVGNDRQWATEHRYSHFSNLDM